MKILISPGFGAGWSTWEHPNMAFDRVLIEAFERGITLGEMEQLCIERGYTSPYGDPPYMGGFKQLEVREIPSGTLFKIREYDGSEFVEVFDEDDWYISEGEYYDID